MKRIKVGPAGINVSFNAAEADLLSSIAAQLAELVGAPENRSSDPALQRLLPDAYRESDEDAQEFRRFTEGDLVDEKVRAAAAIAEALAARGSKGDAEVLLSPADAVSWLRSINDMRLALAARLGIEDDSGPAHPDEDGYAIYSWLGQVQYLLLRAIDR